MPFEKGRQKTGGRQPGSPNQRTKEWEALGNAIATKHTERFNKILEGCNDDKFMQHFKDVLDYFQPRLARTDNVNTDTVEQVIRFEYANNNTAGATPSTEGSPEEQEEV